MKVLILEINGQKYTTGKITAYLSREALKIQKESLELAKMGQEMQQGFEGDEVEMADKALTQLSDLKDRKSWLICEVYGSKFDVETLEKCLSDEEIDEEINKILYGIKGVVAKN